VLAIPLICLPRTSNVCQYCQPDPARLAKPGRTLLIPNATSLQDRTGLLGIIFAEKGVRPYFQERSKVKSGKILMRSFIDGHGGSSSNGLIQEELDVTVSPNDTHTSAPAIMGSEEISRQESTIVERQPNGKEQEIIKVKVEMSEEIQRLNSELDGMGILVKKKEKQIRRSKRRSKLRIYLP
jgi:hypothetical protein